MMPCLASATVRRSVGLLVIEIGLRLRKRGLRSADLGLGIDRGAGDFALVLALGFHGFAQLRSVAGNGGFRGLACGGKIVALDDGDELAGLDGLAFFDSERLDAAGNFGADQHLIGVDGADQLEIAGSASGKADTR